MKKEEIDLYNEYISKFKQWLYSEFKYAKLVSLEDGVLSHDSFDYSKSWAKLMPIVFDINRNYCCIEIKKHFVSLRIKRDRKVFSRMSRYNTIGDRESVFRIVGEFAKWHNENIQCL